MLCSVSISNSLHIEIQKVRKQAADKGQVPEKIIAFAIVISIHHFTLKFGLYFGYCIFVVNGCWFKSMY